MGVASHTTAGLTHPHWMLRLPSLAQLRWILRDRRSAGSRGQGWRETCCFRDSRASLRVTRLWVKCLARGWQPTTTYGQEKHTETVIPGGCVCVLGGGGGGVLQTWHGIGTSPGIKAVGTIFSLPWGSLPGSKRSTSSKTPSSIQKRMIAWKFINCMVRTSVHILSVIHAVAMR